MANRYAFCDFRRLHDHPSSFSSSYYLAPRAELPACAGRVAKTLPQHGAVSARASKSRNKRLGAPHGFTSLLSRLRGKPFGAIHSEMFIPANVSSTGAFTVADWIPPPIEQFNFTNCDLIPNSTAAGSKVSSQLVRMAIS